MAVSLVCCGVQFTDSTVQCTAGNYSGLGTSIPVVCSNASGQVNICLCSGNFFCVTPASSSATWYPCVTGDSSAVQRFYMVVCNPTSSFTPCLGNVMNDLVSHWVGYCNFYNIPCPNNTIFRAEKTPNGLCYELFLDNVVLTTPLNSTGPLPMIVGQPCFCFPVCCCTTYTQPTPYDLGIAISCSCTCFYVSYFTGFSNGGCTLTNGTQVTSVIPILGTFYSNNAFAKCRFVQCLASQVYYRHKEIAPTYYVCCAGCCAFTNISDVGCYPLSLGPRNFLTGNITICPTSAANTLITPCNFNQWDQCVSKYICNIQVNGIISSCWLTKSGFNFCSASCLVICNGPSSNWTICNCVNIMPCIPYGIIDTVNGCTMACDLPFTNVCFCTIIGSPCPGCVFITSTSSSTGPILGVLYGFLNVTCGTCGFMCLNGTNMCNCSNLAGNAVTPTIILSRLDNCTVCAITYYDNS